MPKGTVDPERPQRIAKAAFAVVAERGVEGLTHRAVAAAADIPLGSTTYHFKTLDDLLAAALLEAKHATDVELRKWADALEPGADLGHALAEYVMDALTHHWDRTVVEIELYMAALRRPALLSLSREWDATLVEALAERCDADTARALGMVVDGLFVHAMIHGMPTLGELESVLSRVAT
jgi:DNA-binding transcriptional regulator YbjK